MSRSLALASLLLAFAAGSLTAAGPQQVQAPLQAPSKAPIQAPVQAPVQSPPKQQTITRTIMVPQIQYKTMIVPQVVCKPVVRQRTVPVTRMVPETTMVVRRIPVVTPQPRTRVETYTVCHLDFETVNDTIAVPVPYTEMRQGVRTECRPVKETVMQRVCQETGHCEVRATKDCNGCVHECRVWVPEVIEKQVPVTVWRPEYVQVPFEYPVTVCRLESRNITRQVPRPRYETKEREVHYTVPVTTFVEREVPHTVCRPVTEERVINYTEIVRETVERQVTVPVCTMVAKTITCTVDCGPCGY